MNYNVILEELLNIGNISSYYNSQLLSHEPQSIIEELLSKLDEIKKTEGIYKGDYVKIISTNPQTIGIVTGFTSFGTIIKVNVPFNKKLSEGFYGLSTLEKSTEEEFWKEHQHKYELHFKKVQEIKKKQLISGIVGSLQK